MSEFFSEKWSALEPYVPGEQPRNVQLVKLNTNESPFPPSAEVAADAAARMRNLNLYPDPTYLELRQSIALHVGARCTTLLSEDMICVGNGSDEVLNFAFGAWADENCPAVFADITYGFYPVFAAMNRVPYVEVPLKADWTMPLEEFSAPGRKLLVVANPNAPTGIALTRDQIEDLLKANVNNVVVVDEAYVDFGAQSAIPLIDAYPNLVVTQTFSKSRSMAGARLGFAVANPALIADLETLRNSTNPYNINNATVAWALATLDRDMVNVNNNMSTMMTRINTTRRLRDLGFEVLESAANFVFARHPKMSGDDVYAGLRQRGVLVRHFKLDRIKDFNRITIGTDAQMDVLIAALTEMLEA